MNSSLKQSLETIRDFLSETLIESTSTLPIPIQDIDEKLVALHKLSAEARNADYATYEMYEKQIDKLNRLRKQKMSEFRQDITLVMSILDTVDGLTFEELDATWEKDKKRRTIAAVISKYGEQATYDGIRQRIKR